jgi:hypothetical protein
MAPLPAPKFDLFIDAFEKMVAEAQERIRKTEDMEQPYNIVRDALTALRLPHDICIKLHSEFLHIQMKALPSDKLADLERVERAIGTALFEAGLHKNPEGTRRSGGTWHDIAHTWYCVTRRGAATVHLVIVIPAEGIVDLAVVTNRYQITDTRYELVPRSKVLPPPPPIPDELIPYDLDLSDPRNLPF